MDNNTLQISGTIHQSKEMKEENIHRKSGLPAVFTAPSLSRVLFLMKEFLPAIKMVS